MGINNQKGQINFFFMLMVGVILFILAFAFASPLITNSNQVRSNLDCGNTSIDTSQKVTCIVVDITSPWIISLIIGLGGAILVAKLSGG